MEELNAINKNEDEINTNILLFGKNNQIIFKDYYILNKAWFDNYKISLKTQYNNDLFTNIQNIYPKAITKVVIIHKKNKTYTFPSNFVLVNKKILDNISSHFNQKNEGEINKLSYKVLIFGECIIIKSRTKENIIYVSILKEKNNNNNDTSYENEILYIFEFNDSNSMERELKFMNQKNFKEYLKFKNLLWSNNCDYKEVKNEKQKIIGYIIYNHSQILSETSLFMKGNKSLENPIKQKTQKIETKVNLNSYLKSILLGLNHFENFTKGLNDIIKINPNYKLINKISQCLDDISKNKIFDVTIEYEFISSINTNKCENIIKEILDKLDNELNMNKKRNNNNNKLFQNNEANARQNFKLVHGDPTFIENTFYLLSQNKLFCQKCNLNMFYYEYNQFLLIDIDKKEKEIKVKDKLFEIKNKYESCHKCGNKCKIEIKFEEFPQILIVVIKSKNDEKFFLKNNFKIIENKQFLYSLHCIIEKNTNNFYFLNKSNWYKFDITTNEQIVSDKNIQDINPSVLFFAAKFSQQKYQNSNQINNSMMLNYNNNMQMNFNINNNVINNNSSMMNMKNKINFNNINNINDPNIMNNK